MQQHALLPHGGPPDPEYLLLRLYRNARMRAADAAVAWCEHPSIETRERCLQALRRFEDFSELCGFSPDLADDGAGGTAVRLPSGVLVHFDAGR